MVALTRADGFVLVFAVALHNIVGITVGGRNSTWTRHEMVKRWGLFLGVFSVYFAWRLWYYGYPFPNTFYAKVGTGTSQLVRGYSFLIDALRFYLGGSLIPALLLIPVLQRLRELPISFGATVLLAHSLYTVAVGGGTLVLYRFYLPLVPWLYLFLGYGVWLGGKWLLDKSRRFFSYNEIWRARLLQATLLLSALPLLWCSSVVWRERLSGLETAREIDYHRIVLGKWLGENLQPQVSLAVAAAGAIPYYSERLTIDMLGLNDVYIAHKEMPIGHEKATGHEKYDAAYVLSRHPSLIILPFEWQFAFTWRDWERAVERRTHPRARYLHDLAAQPELKANYEPVSFCFESMGDLHCFHAFARRGEDVFVEPIAGWVLYGERSDSDVEATIEFYSKVVDSDPANARANHSLGRALLHSRRVEEALVYLERSVALSPENGWYWATLGNGYRAAESYHKAIAAYEKAVELNPKVAYYYRLQGEVYEILNEIPAARKAYQEALKIDPHDVKARDGLNRLSSP